jgi:hypothetical protein
MRRLSYLVAAGALALTVGSANAMPFDWSYSDGGSNVGSGTLDATLQSGNEYLVTSMSGTAEGFAITGFFSPGGFAGNDDLIFSPSSQQLDESGISFAISNGDLINLFAEGPFEYLFFAPGGGEDETVITFSATPEGATATPLPATLPLFAGGLGFVGYLAKRRKQNGKQAIATA